MTTPKTAYRWARLYIKFVRLLALLCLLAGLLSFAGSLWSSMLEYQRAKYTASPLITAHYTALRNNYAAVIGILRSRNIGVVDNTATLFLDFAQPPRGSAQLNELLANLAKVTAEIETMQGRYFNSFARPIDSLLGTMAEHAAVLRKQLGETGGKPAAHQSEDPGALSSVQERSPQDPRSKLYVSVSENELDQLVTVKNCLLDLQTQASKDSTRQQFVEAIKALEVYMSIIKGELPLPVALLKAHALPRLNPEEPAVPKIDLKVDDLIRILANYKATVQAGVLSNWRVSAKLDDMLSLVHAEFKECLARELTGRQIIIQSIFLLAKIACISIIIAFLALVLADFLQAIIDTPDLLRIATDSQS